MRKDTNHQWSLELKEHIASTIHDRNVAEQAEESCFDADYIAAFNSRLDKILQHGGDGEHKKPDANRNNKGSRGWMKAPDGKAMYNYH